MKDDLYSYSTPNQTWSAVADEISRTFFITSRPVKQDSESSLYVQAVHVLKYQPIMEYVPTIPNILLVHYKWLFDLKYNQIIC